MRKTHTDDAFMNGLLVLVLAASGQVHGHDGHPKTTADEATVLKHGPYVTIGEMLPDQSSKHKFFALLKKSDAAHPFTLHLLRPKPSPLLSCD